LQACFKIRIFGAILRFSEDRDDILNLHHEKAIVALEIDGDGPLGIEQNFVVLPQRYVRRVFDLGGNCDDSAGDCGNFDIVRQLDAALGLFLVFVSIDFFVPIFNQPRQS